MDERATTEETEGRWRKMSVTTSVGRSSKCMIVTSAQVYAGRFCDGMALCQNGSVGRPIAGGDVTGCCQNVSGEDGNCLVHGGPSLGDVAENTILSIALIPVHPTGA